MSCDERRFLLQELRQTREFVEQNWTDELGRQVSAWICQTEGELAHLEEQITSCTEKAEEIARWCRQAADSDSDTRQKVLKLEHTPPLHR